MALKVVAEAQEKAKVDSETTRSIQRAHLTARKEQVEAKRIALVNKRQCSAQAVYEKYKADVANSAVGQDGEPDDVTDEFWMSSTVEQINVLS